MKKVWIFLAFILIILVLTNPTKDDYSAWLNEKALSNSNGIIEKGITSILFNEKLISSATTTNNYVFFSTYKTATPDEPIKYIGAFNNFFGFDVIIPIIIIILFIVAFRLITFVYVEIRYFVIQLGEKIRKNT